MNLFKDVPTWTDKEKGVLNVVIEIPKGESNKYEYDHEGGYFALDRTLYHQMFHPFNYGFLPQTWYDDEDPVDVCLLSTYPLAQGCVVKARVIGALDTSDQSGRDLKVFAVPISKLDPRFDEVKSYSDLPTHVQSELYLHFKEIKKLELEKYDKVIINGWREVAFAISEIKRAQAQYADKDNS